MAGIKNLAKQTAVYGLSSILGRFLNWCLAPMYTFCLASQADYGIYTNVYAWIALLIVILTYGMETGFFRFANEQGADAPRVFGTAMISVGSSSAVFAVIAVLSSPFIASSLGYGPHADYVAIMCLTVAIDAFCCLPLAFLRFQQRAAWFAVVNLIMIGVNIFFNIFFLIVCPWLASVAPSLVSWFYSPDYSVGYVFVANLLSTLAKLLLLLPTVRLANFNFDRALLHRMLVYSLPLLVLGVAGIMNQTVDKILFPGLFVSGGHSLSEAHSQLGVYGACFKVAMVMMMFTQAFRYAYEPFVFARNKNGDKRGEYADAMKFYVIFSLLIVLFMLFFLSLVKVIISPDYWQGLVVVPVVLLTYLFQGVYFNLSIWYKLIDKTSYGAVFSLVGLVITVALNVALVPSMGYYASALASLCCFVVVTLLSYLVGQRMYKVPYDLLSIGLYFGLSCVLFAVACFLPSEGFWGYALKSVLLCVYLGVVFKRDLPLRSLPFVGRFFR